MSTPIKEFLFAIVPHEHTWKITLLEQWPTIIGSLSTHVRIHSITDRLLFLHVTHPVWAQELTHLTPLIKQRINGLLGQERIVEIRFTITKPSTHTSSTRKISTPLKKKATPSYTLSHKEETQLTQINDQELQDALRTFLIACK